MHEIYLSFVVSSAVNYEELLEIVAGVDVIELNDLQVDNDRRWYRM